SGSGYGGTLFSSIPLSSHFGVDWSLDLAGGHTTYSSWSPAGGMNALPTIGKRSFLYTNIPVYMTYRVGSKNAAAFIGLGLSYTRVTGDQVSLHGGSINNVTFLGLPVKIGCELYQHIVLSVETAIAKTYLSNNDTRIDNIISAKLGYVFTTTKHSASPHARK
ncbi:MAG TPA: hypothetical protein VI233_16360, partial [Puia sp.]